MGAAPPATPREEVHDGGCQEKAHRHADSDGDETGRSIDRGAKRVRVGRRRVRGEAQKTTISEACGCAEEGERRRCAVARGRRAHLMAAGRRCCTHERKRQVSAQPQGWTQKNLERGAPDNTDEHCALPREPAPRVAEEADRERPDKGRECRHILELPA